MKKRTKVIVVLAGAVVAILCATGVAFAANGAVPGDALYGLDRAAESIGIGNGGYQERLAEATTLADQGDSQQALAHVANTCGETVAAGVDNAPASAALNAAANAVASANQGESDQIRARVAEMLHWMASTNAAAEDFGQGVATRARAISGVAGDDQGPQQNQNSDGEGQTNQNGTSSQNGTSGGTQTTEQEPSGDCLQDGDGEQEQNQNGVSGETQNTESEQNGDCEQNGAGEQNGDCEQTQDGELDQNQTQTNRPESAGKR